MGSLNAIIEKYHQDHGPAVLQNRMMESIEYETNSGCWLWRKYLDPYGYGRMSLNGTQYQAHRISFAMNWPLPDDLLVCHRCDTPACVNSSHFFLGDRQANMDDCVSKRRHRFGKTHHKAILSELDVLFVRSFCKKRGDASRVARLFGVNPNTIYLILNGTNWRHI